MTTEKLVLIVDDEAEVRDYLSAVLEDAGFGVDTAADGDEALEKLNARKPDFISLDLVMPNRSGVKFLYALRKNREWSRIPVMIVTGHARDDLGRGDMEEIMEGRVMSGPACYLEKPVRPASYVAAIRRQLGLEVEDSPSPSIDTMRSELANLAEGADPVRLEAAMRLLRGESPVSNGNVNVVRPTKESSASLTGRTILVVDDEPDVAEYISTILGDHGCQTRTASNAAEAMERLREGPFDLVTLDVDMPGKTGIRLYRDIKADPDLKGIKVVVVTGMQQDIALLFEGKRTVPKLDGYLVKPFEPEALIETIKHALVR